MEKDDLYDKKYYKELEFGFSSEARLDHERILELLKVTGDEKVLEIGCGFGVLLKKIPSQRKMGVESNDVAISECLERGLSVIKADAENKLPFEDLSFDSVIMNEVIEHLRDPEFTLRECFRILKPEGKIIVTTPSRNFFVHDLSATHLSEMTIGEMRGLMKKCGYNILSHEVCGISFLHPILENLIFKPSRLLRERVEEKKGIVVRLIDFCHTLADKTVLRPTAVYRKTFLGLGWDQMVFAQKKDGERRICP